MNALLRMSIAAAALLTLTGATNIVNYSGVYVGTYTLSQVPGPQKISLTFQQSGVSMMATYHTATGVYGTGHGVLNGNVATMAWQNTTPSCPGQYKGQYTFTPGSVTWSYTANDCLGPEKGTGQAKQVTTF